MTVLSMLEEAKNPPQGDQHKSCTSELWPAKAFFTCQFSWLTYLCVYMFAKKWSRRWERGEGGGVGERVEVNGWKLI
jgi:hypothetical protein